MPSKGRARTRAPRGSRRDRIRWGPRSHLYLLPENRREIVFALKTRGPLPVEEIAGIVGITVSGARQQLSVLERDDLVTHDRIRSGPGRPRHLYRLTRRGDSLFPRRYAELATEILDFVSSEDPELVERFFERRTRRRVEMARTRLRGLGFSERVHEVAKIMEGEGYLTEVRDLPDGSFLLVELNCALGDLVREHEGARGSELEFLRGVLPDAEVHRASGPVGEERDCAFEIRPASGRSEQNPTTQGDDR